MLGGNGFGVLSAPDSFIGCRRLAELADKAGTKHFWRKNVSFDMIVSYLTELESRYYLNVIWGAASVPAPLLGSGTRALGEQRWWIVIGP